MSGTRCAGSWLWRTRTSKWPRKLKHEKVTACEPFSPHLAFALAWPREMTKSRLVRDLVMRQVVLIATLLVGSLVSAGALELQETRSKRRHSPPLSRPTTPAKFLMRHATSSGCSTTLVEWVTTPGMRIFPSGNFTSFHTIHSCSCLGLALSSE